MLQATKLLHETQIGELRSEHDKVLISVQSTILPLFFSTTYFEVVACLMLSLLPRKFIPMILKSTLLPLLVVSVHYSSVVQLSRSVHATCLVEWLIFAGEVILSLSLF